MKKYKRLLIEAQSAIETLQKEQALLKSQKENLKPGGSESNAKRELERWKREFTREKESRENFEKLLRQREREIRDLKEAIEEERRGREYSDDEDPRRVHGRKSEIERLREELDLERDEREEKQFEMYGSA